VTVFEFKLPDLGEGIHEGEIVKWYVQVGDVIKEEDPLVDVETDKAAVTIPSPVSGKVVQLGGEVGGTVMVGAVIAVIEETGAVPETAPEPEAPPRIETPVPISGPPPAAPATRRLARELGVELILVTPSGPGGRITPEDVKLFAETSAAAPTEESVAAKIEVPDEAAVEENLAEAEYAAQACATIPFLDLEPLPDFEQWGPVEKQPLRSIRRKVAHKMVTSMTLVPYSSGRVPLAGERAP
jgi:pyruvate dehydrogenase E2 component (dihydrolipoamide acetyltransferase)